MQNSKRTLRALWGKAKGQQYRSRCGPQLKPEIAFKQSPGMIDYQKLTNVSFSRPSIPRRKEFLQDCYRIFLLPLLTMPRDIFGRHLVDGGSLGVEITLHIRRIDLPITCSDGLAIDVFVRDFQLHIGRI